MDEMDLTLPPELETALNGFYSSSKPDAAFASHLELELRCQHVEFQRSSSKSHCPFYSKWGAIIQTMRARPALVILLVLLALGLLTGVAYAIGRLSGFIPGFGFVSDAASALVLETPVETTENGIGIRVEKAVNDSSRFWVEMTLSQNPHPETLYDATVLLPDGQTIALQQMGWHEPLSGNVPILFEFPHKIKGSMPSDPC